MRWAAKKKCDEQGCTKVARYAMPGGNAGRCIVHQTAGMVLVMPYGKAKRPCPLDKSTAPLPQQAETATTNIMDGEHKSVLPDSRPRSDGACAILAATAAAAPAACLEFAGAHFISYATPGTPTAPLPPVGLPASGLELLLHPVCEPFPSHSGSVRTSVPTASATVAVDAAAVVGGCCGGSNGSPGGGGAREGGTGAASSPEAVRDEAHMKRRRVGEVDDNATVTFVACGEPPAIHVSGARAGHRDAVTTGARNGSNARVTGGGWRGGRGAVVAAVATKAVRRVGARSGKGAETEATCGRSKLQQLAPHPMKWPSMSVQGFLPGGRSHAPGLTPAGGLNLTALLQQYETAGLCFPPRRG